MTHVVVAIGGRGASGISTYATELHGALAARGYTVDVLVAERNPPGRRILGRVFPRAYARPGSSWLRSRVRALRPDLVHVVSSDLLAVDLGVPTVWTAWHDPHGFVGRWNASLDMRPFGMRQVLWEMAGSWPGYRLDDGALHRASRVVAASHRLAESLSARGWRATVIPPMLAAPAGARVRSLPAVPRVVFSSANLGAPRKGLRFLVQAFERLDDPTRLAVDLIGEPDAGARELLRGSRLSKVATVHGRADLERARNIMGSASILAMPSRSEEFGYVALEALALGLPVVAFDVPTLDEILTSECSRRVPPLDARAFAAALKEVATDGDAYRGLSEGALQRARAFSPSVRLPELEAVYRAAMEAG